MATGSLVPSSTPIVNPSMPSMGNTGSAITSGTGATAVPTSNILSPGSVAVANPLVPAAATTPTVSASPTSSLNLGSGLEGQLTDIYGSGVGNALNDLLGSISGVDSTTLQEFQQSLAPQEATAQTNLDASLGAGGVSANSSVAAIGNANLEAQETSAVAGEEAQLQQQQLNLETGILTGTEPAAVKETAESGWDVFGNVLNAIGSDASQVVGGLAKGGYL